MLYHFARDVEVEKKNMICNNVLWYEFIESVTAEWNMMFRMVDIAVGNVTDQKIDLAAKAEEIYAEYFAKFSPLIKGVNASKKKSFLEAVSKIVTMHRVEELKMRKEAFKLVYSTLEQAKNFPFMESEKSFIIIVLSHVHTEILNKIMGD